MARRRGRRRGRKSLKIPVVTLAILGGQVLAARAFSDGTVLGALGKFGQFYSGVNPMTGQFNATDLSIGWLPWLAKGLVSKVARPMGAAPRVPFGLPISIS